MGGVDGAHHVDLEHPLPVGGLQPGERKSEFSGADSGGKHHVARESELVLESVGGGLHFRFRTDVGNRGSDGGPCRLGDGRGALGHGRGPVDHPDPGAFIGEGLRDGPTNALGGSDDDGGLMFEVEVHGMNLELAEAWGMNRCRPIYTAILEVNFHNINTM